MIYSAQLTPPKARVVRSGSSQRPKVYHWDQLARIIGRAIERGATRSTQMRFHWNCAGPCEAPVVRELIARPALKGRKTVVIGPGKRSTLLLELEAPCRRCDKCRNRRRWLWAMRAKSETAHAPRTWFGTLTLRPEEQFRMLGVARQRLDRQGVSYEALPIGEQFILRHNEISKELTKYVKRIRKESAAPMTYLIVAEQHKSGDPHYHMLVHEQSIDMPIRHKTLTGQWALGFTRWKLIEDPNAAVYLCKYLSKSSAARVRASLGYGRL